MFMQLPMQCSPYCILVAEKGWCLLDAIFPENRLIALSVARGLATLTVVLLLLGNEKVELCQNCSFKIYSSPETK